MISNPRTPRISSRFRTVAVIAFVLLIPVAAWSLWDYAEARRFRRMVEEIQSRGEPVSTTRYQPAQGKAEENAARYYQAAAALVFSTDVYRIPGLSRALAAGGPQHDEALAAARAWLEKHREAEALLSRATAMEFLGNEAPLRTLDPIVRLDRLAGTRRVERLEARDGDAAARALTAQTRVARLAPAGEFMTRSSLFWVTRGLADIPRLLALAPSSATLAGLSAAIAEQDVDDLVRQFAVSLRANELQSFWNPSAGWYRPPSRNLPGPLQLLVRPWAAHGVLEELQVLTRFVEHSSKPWPDRVRIEAPGTEPPITAHRNWLGVHENEGWLPYWFRRTARELAALTADLRAARTAVAIEQFRREIGRLPDRLDQLTPRYLDHLPTDPFSGRPLVYRSDAQSFLVYSLGDNETDDGGKIERSAPEPGVGERRLDIGLLVPLTSEMTSISR